MLSIHSGGQQCIRLDLFIILGFPYSSKSRILFPEQCEILQHKKKYLGIKCIPCKILLWEMWGLDRNPPTLRRNWIPEKRMDCMLLSTRGMGSTPLPFLVRLQLTVQAGGYVQWVTWSGIMHAEHYVLGDLHTAIAQNSVFRHRLWSVCIMAFCWDFCSVWFLMWRRGFAAAQNCSCHCRLLGMFSAWHSGVTVCAHG